MPASRAGASSASTRSRPPRLVLGSGAFAFYVPRFGHYNESWDSLSAVVVILTWFWLSSLPLLGANSAAAALARLPGRDPLSAAGGTRRAASSAAATSHSVNSRLAASAAAFHRWIRAASTFSRTNSTPDGIRARLSFLRRARSSLRDQRLLSARPSHSSCSSSGSAATSAWWAKLRLSRRRDTSKRPATHA